MNVKLENTLLTTRYTLHSVLFLAHPVWKYKTLLFIKVVNVYAKDSSTPYKV